MKVVSDLSSYRKDFPILQKTVNKKPLIYFDTAATAQKPKQVIDALYDFYTNHYGTVHRSVYTLAEEAEAMYHRARRSVQTFLNAAHPEEIIFTRGATTSLNLVAHSFGKSFLQPGDVILISQIEHHSNIVPWQMVCDERGALLRTIPINERGELIMEAFEELLDEKVKMVSIAHVSNVIGTLHPVEEIIKAAHRVGARVCIDGAQAVPHLPVDVQALDADFYAFSGHKLYGPTGAGVLYGKRELLDRMAPWEGGGDMIERVSFEKTTYNQLPYKFEAGTPNVAAAIGLGASIDYLNQIGMEVIHSWEKELLAYATEKLVQIPGLKIIGTAENKGAIISFIIDGIHPLDLATFLNCEGIAIRTGHHCSQPTMDFFGISGTARISFGLYNTLEEIDRFVFSLQNILSILK